MDSCEDVIVDGEGVHFLVGLNPNSAESDDSNVSSVFSYSEEDPLGDIKVVEPEPKKLRCQIKWLIDEANTINPFPFTGAGRLRFARDDPEPIDFFYDFCQPAFLGQILSSTNHYARGIRSVEGSNLCSWKMLTLSELTIFLGLVFHTGTIRMNELSDYWSTNKLFELKIFRTRMTKERFVQILSTIRFGERPITYAKRGVKLASIQSLVKLFNSIVEKVYCPGRELVIGNCLAVAGNAIIPIDSVNSLYKKPGLYLHSLSEPNGFVHKVVINEDASMTNNSHAVESLMEGKTNRGHALYLDTNYCTIAGVLNLLVDRTYCTGILEKDNKEVPTDMMAASSSKGGSPVIRFCEPGLCILKWRGREDIIAVSSEFCNYDENQVDNVKRRPRMVSEYLKTTRWMERRELITSYKPLDGKNVDWYTAIGIHFLQLMMMNSYLLYNSNIRSMSFHEYRLSVIASLVQRDTINESIPANFSFPKTCTNISLTTTADDLHVPKKFPKRDGQRSLRKRCKVCLTKGKRTDSYYHCPLCPNEPALCLDICFAAYHKALKNRTSIGRLQPKKKSNNGSKKRARGRVPSSKAEPEEDSEPPIKSEPLWLLQPTTSARKQ